ncbi:MAG: hypothetical protein V4670_12250 [Bacteroidota bacterium]
MSDKKVTRQLSIFINDREVVNSFAGIGREINKVSSEMRNLNKSSATYDQDLQKLSSELTSLKTKQGDFREELGFTNKELQKTGEVSGGLRGTLSGIWDSLASGDLQGAKEGITSIKDGLGGMVKSSLAFIATPIGAAIAVLAGFAAGAKAIFDFNVNAEKSAQLIENLSGKTGQVVEDIRVKMQAMSDTFEVGFDSLAGAVDNLVDTGVAKNELEALDKIKNGLLTAPDKNEFVASLESSAVTAKQVGLSLEEVISLKQAIEETGVNPEATFGALEKAGKNLALQTDKLREGLTSAFGAAFTDDILAKVKTGQLTTVQALDLINTKSKEVGLNQTQQAEIGAQLFGKAAQSAGGYATILDTVSGGLKKQNQELNGNQKALSDLADANEKLQKAQSELFRVQDFGELWTKIKAAAIDALAGIITFVSDLKKDIQPLLDIVGVAFVNSWYLFKAAFVTTFDIIGAVVKGFFDYLKFGFNFIKAILTGDFRGAIALVGNYFTSLGATVQNLFGKIKNTIIDTILSIVKNVAPILDALGFDVDKIQKKLESFKSKDIKISTSSESTGDSSNPEAKNTKDTEEELAKQKALRDAARQKELDAQQKARDAKKAADEKAAKEALDIALAYAKAQQDLAKAELAYYISNQRSKLDSTIQLTPEIIAEETRRLEEIKFRQENALAEERLFKIAKAEQDAKSDEELALLKQTIDYDYLVAQQTLELDFQKSTDALKTQYEQEQKVLKAEQLALDNELAIAEADNKFEADKIKQTIDYQAQLDRYKTLFENKKITEAEYIRFKAAAEDQQAELDKQREIGKVQATLGSFQQLGNALGELFGQSKELAITQAIINGALAVTSILSAASMGNPILDAVVKGVQIVATVATTVSNINKIRNAKEPKKPKFYHGGDTGSNPALGYDEYGPVTGYVHQNEYVIPEVMTKDPRFANTIGWLEQNRQRKLKGYVDGGSTSPQNLASGTPAQAQDFTSMLLQAIGNLNTILSAGIKSNVIFGYDDVQKIEDMKTEINQSTENGTLS